MTLPGLYLITDRKLVPGGDLLAALDAALRGGARLIQLREKDLSGGELLRLAEVVKELTDRYQANLLINDRVDVAAAVRAHGVHLGSRSIPIRDARDILGDKALIGYSAHSREEGLMASRLGADFITLGPLFPTRKEYPTTLVGLEALQEACLELSVPVFALGGINAENAAAAFEASAKGIALISYVFADPDPESRTQEILGVVESLRPSAPSKRRWFRRAKKG